MHQFTSERVLTVQLLGKEDHVSEDALSSEEKWSLYVDQFLQLSTNEPLSGSQREPFLKRNLPINVNRESPENVVTSSGLELKICMDTYKIFFVENTEDYFYRKHVTEDLVSNDTYKHLISKDKKLRFTRFREWLDSSETGWKKNLSDPALAQKQFESLKESGTWIVQNGLGESFRKLRLNF